MRSYNVENIGMLLRALSFAAEKHQNERRKGEKQLPYINHPIQVANTLWEVGRVHDLEVLAAALLHDTLEDTDATPDEIRTLGGDAVLALVKEVTDDKSLPKHKRKQRQVAHAAHASPQAKLIKLADKINNVIDLSHEPPAGWSHERIIEYLNWSEDVVLQIRGTNQWLEAEFDRVLAEARTLTEESEKHALP